jgi:hypothetical protein
MRKWCAVRESQALFDSSVRGFDDGKPFKVVRTFEEGCWGWDGVVLNVILAVGQFQYI